MDDDVAADKARGCSPAPWVVGELFTVIPVTDDGNVVPVEEAKVAERTPLPPLPPPPPPPAIEPAEELKIPVEHFAYEVV